MKVFLFLFTLSFSGIASGQNINFYSPFGIKEMKIQISDNSKSCSIEADSIYINGFATNLQGIKILYSEIEGVKQIYFGDFYSVRKVSDFEYNYIREGDMKIVDLKDSKNDEQEFSKEESTRFLIMATILNYLSENNEYESDPNQRGLKKCGTWEITGYGHSQTGSMLNASQEATQFDNNNVNCMQSGSPSTSCIVGEHFCFTTYTFHCSCDIKIPFLGIGW